MNYFSISIKNWVGSGLKCKQGWRSRSFKTHYSCYTWGIIGRVLYALISVQYEQLPEQNPCNWRKKPIRNLPTRREQVEPPSWTSLTLWLQLFANRRIPSIRTIFGILRNYCALTENYEIAETDQKLRSVFYINENIIIVVTSSVHWNG